MPQASIMCFLYRNPGVRTIEDDLLAAMCKAKAFPEHMENDLSKARNFPGEHTVPITWFAIFMFSFSSSAVHAQIKVCLQLDN